MQKKLILPHKSVLTPYDLAYSNLLSYIAIQYPAYTIAPHHRLIADKLQAVERGEIKRLMIFVPPRHGKSTLSTIYFPAWYLGRNPDRQVISASYGDELAVDFGKQVRNQLLDPLYDKIFPGSAINRNDASAGHFTTLKKGVYNAMGVGGPGTGRGGHLFLIDDPVKNREDADSETKRRNAKEWYTSTAYTRLEKDDSAIIIILTRWHEDDLAGWILREHSHENWTVINLPAIAEQNDILGRKEGEPLWPEKFNKERLETIRRTVGVRDWNALFQQRPAPLEGDFFKHKHFQFYDRLPEIVHYYGASDYAVTADGGDYTIHMVLAVDQFDNIYLAELWRKQESSDVWVEILLDFMQKYKPLAWAEENGQIEKSVGPFINKRMMERRVYCTREQYTSAADKPTRAQSIRARAAMGKVYLPRHAPWLPDLIHELLTFPNGKNDDQVDTLSLFSRMLDGLRPAVKPQEQEKFVVNTALPTVNQVFEEHLRKARMRDIE